MEDELLGDGGGSKDQEDMKNNGKDNKKKNRTMTNAKRNDKKLIKNINKSKNVEEKGILTRTRPRRT